MGQVIQRRLLGLHADTSPETAPPGSLLQAVNVWMRRPGILEPRPGLASQSIASLSVPSGYSIYRLFPFNDDLVAVATDGSGNWRVYSVTAGTTHSRFGTSSTAWTGTIGCVHAAEMAGNLYITTDNGVMRVTAPGTAAVYRTGLERPGQCITDVDTTAATYPNRPLTANSAIAYRFVQARKVGDRWIRSAPSGRVVERSYTGSSAKALRLFLSQTVSGVASIGDLLNGDLMEVYRSVAFTSDDPDTPTDEMALLTTDIYSTGWGIPRDDTTTAGLIGPALYTNETQQGALQENGRPPMCRDIAAYNQMMFFGGATWPATLTFDILSMGPAWRDSSASTLDRFTTFTISGTTTNLSTTVSGVSAADIAKLTVGQRVHLDGGNPNAADARFPDGTLIATIGATSFTTTNAATASGATTLRISDWIELSINNGSTYTQRLYCFNTDNGAGTADDFFNCQEFTASTAAEVRGVQDYARHSNAYFATTSGAMAVHVFGDGEYSPWSVHCEQIGVVSRTSPATITAKSSKPAVTRPAIDSVTGIANTVRGGVNVLAYSKVDEPEAVPPENWVAIGAEDKAIQRVIAARDGLYVFKADGVWRVSGYTPETLTVDEYDRNMTLIHPDAACAYDGRVAAWTNKGVVLIGGGGTEVISGAINTSLEASKTVSPTDRGTWLASWPYHDLLVLGMTSGATMLVYHARTQQWSQWTHALGPDCHSGAALGSSFYVGGKLSSAAVLLKSNSTTKDAEYSITISAVDSAGTGITISAGSGWTPAVNDCVVQSSVAYAITAVTSATVFTVQAAGLTAAAATAEVGAPVTVLLNAEDAGDPLGQKHWREAKWFFSVLAGACRIAFSFFSPRYQAFTSANYFETFQTSNLLPKAIRVPVPRGSRRGQGLIHGFGAGGPRQAWKLSSMSLGIGDTSARVGNDD
jgi:hypothetical protein